MHLSYGALFSLLLGAINSEPARCVHELPAEERGQKGFGCLTPASGAAELLESQLRSCFPACWLLMALCALPASKAQASLLQHTHLCPLHAELVPRRRCRTGLPLQACDVPFRRHVPVRDLGALRTSSLRKAKHPAEKNLCASLPGPFVHSLWTLQEAALCQVKPHGSSRMEFSETGMAN